MTIKMLFDGIETSLKNARIAIFDADRYLDAIKEEVEVMASKVKKSEGIHMETVFNSAKISTGKEDKEVGECLTPNL